MENWIVNNEYALCNDSNDFDSIDVFFCICGFMRIGHWNGIHSKFFVFASFYEYLSIEKFKDYKWNFIDFFLFMSKNISGMVDQINRCEFLSWQSIYISNKLWKSFYIYAVSENSKLHS